MAPYSSAFSIAVEEFISESRVKNNFIHRIWAEKSTVSIDDAHDALSALEKTSSHKASRRILRPVYDALQNYYKVIDTLISADPMPSAFVWGGLKAVIECFGRYTELFDKLEGRMKKLGEELNRLSAYEKLFREFPEMEGLLVHSYSNIIRFWITVESQCMASGFSLLAKSFTSFRTKKIDEILANMTDASENITKLVPIVQEKIRRGEHEDATNEWRKVTFQLEKAFRLQVAERERQRRDKAKGWIEAGTGGVLNGSNDRHQNIRMRELEQGTGEWFFESDEFRHWKESTDGRRVIWLNGGPGVGKSIICSHAVHKLQQDGSVAVAFQYFTHDETDIPLLDLYRNIANQLFHALYKHNTEISDNVDTITQGQLTEQSMECLIEVLVAELNSSFIFLDGIDEECSEARRWKTAYRLLSFFIGLTQRPGSTMKLWCSSQYRSTIMDTLKEPVQIQLVAELNTADIERFIENSLNRECDTLDSKTKTSLLENLKAKVDGNFLWAAMMLETISKAMSSGEIQELVEKGLPLSFQDYLEKKIKSTEKSQYGTLCKTLSCLVYAKRPLLLEELCEAIQISGAEFASNLSTEDGLFRKRLMRNCESLVRFDKVMTSPGHSKELCTLWHGALRKYLHENPDVLAKENRQEYLISPTVLTLGCLKYLNQQRYEGLLSKVPGSFSTVTDEDILEHHFLNYSAKYWRSHMDDYGDTPELSMRVRQFVTSSNFVTCLQIQSLLVDGWFQFWRSKGHRGRHLVRAFPEWFTQKDESGQALYSQYNTGIGEWGYFLNKYAILHGQYPGQLSHCWWQSLGTHNFLSKIESSFKSFVLENLNADEERELPFLLERFSDCGTEVDLFKLYVSRAVESESLMMYERWTIARGRSPKLVMVQEIKFPSVHLKLYLAETKNAFPRRATPLAVSKCGKAIRVGTLVYSRDAKGTFQAVDTTKQDQMRYTDEISCRGRFIAIASRRQLTLGDLQEFPLQEVPDTLSKRAAEANAKGIRQHSSGSSSDTSSSISHSSSEDTKSWYETSDGGADRDQNMPETLSRLNAPQSGMVKSIPESSHSYESEAEYESIKSLSAFESLSEGSTDAASDEIEDESWNDFASEDNQSVFNFTEANGNGDSDGESITIDQISPSASMESFPSPPSSLNSETNSSAELYDISLENDEDDIDSIENFEPYGSSDDDSDSDSDDGGKSNAGKRLAHLLKAGNKGRKQGELAEIRIYKTVQMHDGDAPERVFRFFQWSTLTLLGSPPVFHTDEDLVVWPLGDGDLLFANFTCNSYFIRKLDSGYKSSCQIACHCQFSPCGRHLHIASLDGYVGQDEDGDPALGLRLHVTTHRLSRRKLARCPPRLIYRAALNLSDMYTTDNKLYKLPYTLTWTESHVYVTESQQLLRVHRIPLYRESAQEQEKTREDTGKGGSGTYINTADVFLPRSAFFRNVHFFEGHSQTEKKAKSEGRSRKRDKYTATVLVGSHNPGLKSIWRNTTTPGHIECGRTPPQGVHLKAAQMGEWRPIESHVDNDQGKKMLKSETWRGGLMHDKVEKFDRSEDCDIVPYLGF